VGQRAVCAVPVERGQEGAAPWLAARKRKTFEGSYELKPFGAKPFISRVFQTKYAGYGWGYLDDITDPCEKGLCFFFDKAVFLDKDAKTM